MALNSLKLLDDCDMVAAHVFPFSPRPNTPAARMPQLAPELVKARAARLREAAATRRTRWLDSLVGTSQPVLIENNGKGHTDNFAPVAIADGHAGRERPGADHWPRRRPAHGGLGMSWLDRLRGGFQKTADRVADNLTGLTSRAALDTSTLDDIEEALIASDLGPEASHRIREAIARQKFERLDERGLRSILADEIEKISAPVAKPLEVWGFPRPHVILVIGVNGSGKTTTIGKLAHWLKEQDYGVLLAAGDTFRAAAIEQLQIWGQRVGAPVIAGKEGGDAAGIVFDGVKQATATGEDVLIVDTAGRLQNKTHLMEELAKIRRVLGRLNPEAPHDVLLVLDATTGQNALAQVEVFRETAGVTGLIMTKLDGTARGGILVAAAEKFGLPIHAIGVGETADDLRPFDPRAVARAIAGLPPE